MREQTTEVQGMVKESLRQFARGRGSRLAPLPPTERRRIINHMRRAETLGRRLRTVRTFRRKITAKPVREQSITDYFAARQQANETPREPMDEVLTGKRPLADARLVAAVLLKDVKEEK